MAVGAPFDGRALVVGAWAAGVPDKTVTVAIDYSSSEAKELHRSRGITPSIQGDIMKISLAQLGELNFTRVVFQGCCPIVKAMGAKDCGAGNSYEPIDPSRLAYRLRQIMHKTLPGWIFIRHCESVANIHGIQSLEARKNFIQVFESFHFERIQKFHPPYRLIESHPGADIPDTAPLCLGKWNPENCALVFFKPPCLVEVPPKKTDQ